MTRVELIDTIELACQALAAGAMETAEYLIGKIIKQADSERLIKRLEKYTSAEALIA